MGDTVQHPAITLRPSAPSDAAFIISSYDSAIPWLVAQGSQSQWGTEPLSSKADFVAEMTRCASKGDGDVWGDGKTWIAEVARKHAGAMEIGTKVPDYVEEVLEKGDTVHVVHLTVHRAFKGVRVGDMLLDKAKEEARAAGVRRLTVDCWAGDGQNEKLVEYYEKQGFKRVGGYETAAFSSMIGMTFKGMVLEMPLS